MKNKFSHYSDEDIVFVIQSEYDIYFNSFKWACDKCGFSYSYNELEQQDLNQSCICRKCGGFLSIDTNRPENNCRYPSRDGRFESIWYNEIIERYHRKINKFCQNDEDSVQEIYRHPFIRAIKKFDKSKNTKFNTYFWTCARNFRTDEVRKKSSTVPQIICMICGHEIGNITAEHLFNLNHKFIQGKDGFMGHEAFINYISDLYEENINELPEKQKISFLKKKAKSEYVNLFPEAFVEGKVAYLDEKKDEDEDICLLDQISDDSFYYIEYHKGVSIFNNMPFYDEEIDYLKSNYPEIYELTLNNKDGDIHGISFKYENYEDKRFSEVALNKLTQIIIYDYCNTDRGYTRKSKFYDKTGSLNNNNKKIIYDLIDLYLQGYNYSTICSYIGHDVLEEEDIKHILKILLNSPKCKSLISNLYYD